MSHWVQVRFKLLAGEHRLVNSTDRSQGFAALPVFPTTVRLSPWLQHMLAQTKATVIGVRVSEAHWSKGEADQPVLSPSDHMMSRAGLRSCETQCKTLTKMSGSGKAPSFSITANCFQSGFQPNKTWGRQEKRLSKGNALPPTLSSQCLDPEDSLLECQLQSKVLTVIVDSPLVAFRCWAQLGQSDQNALRLAVKIIPVFSKLHGCAVAQLQQKSHLAEKSRCTPITLRSFISLPRTTQGCGACLTRQGNQTCVQIADRSDASLSPSLPSLTSQF